MNRGRLSGVCSQVADKNEGCAGRLSPFSPSLLWASKREFCSRLRFVIVVPTLGSTLAGASPRSYIRDIKGEAPYAFT